MIEIPVQEFEERLLLSAMERFGYKYRELLDEDEELLLMLRREADRAQYR